MHHLLDSLQLIHFKWQVLHIRPQTRLSLKLSKFLHLLNRIQSQLQGKLRHSVLLVNHPRICLQVRIVRQSTCLRTRWKISWRSLLIVNSLDKTNTITNTTKIGSMLSHRALVRNQAKWNIRKTSTKTTIRDTSWFHPRCQSALMTRKCSSPWCKILRGIQYNQAKCRTWI